MRYTAIFLVLGACAVADRSDAPTIMHSAKAPGPVAECIQGRWLAAGRGYGAIKAQAGDGYTVQLRSGSFPIVIADALPEASGTLVRVYSNEVGDLGLTDQARNCL